MKLKILITLEREFDEEQSFEVNELIKTEGKEKVLQTFNNELYDEADDTYDGSFYNISIESDIT